MTQRVAVLPGGAAHGVNPAAVLCAIKRDYDAYLVNSAGALNGLLLALGKYDEIEHEYHHTTNREMYGFFPPINKHGEFDVPRFLAAALVATTRKKLHLYKFGDVVEKKIRKYFSRDEFYKLRDHGPDIIATVYDLESTINPTSFISIRDDFMTHDKFVRTIAASASIPIFAKPQTIDFGMKGDGGVLDNVPTRPLDKFPHAQVDVWLTHSLRKEEDKRRPVNNLGQICMNMLVAMRNHLSFDDIAAIKNVNTTLYYADHMAWDSANFDPELIANSWNRAQSRVLHNQLNSISIHKWRKAKNLPQLAS